MSAIHQMTARELVCAMQTGLFSAEEVTRHFLSRIRQYDKQLGLNTVAEINERAPEEARAIDMRKDSQPLPLHGLPILVKDNINVAGLHTTAGSRALRDNLAYSDAPVIAALRKCGAIILGKTNMTEFANYTTQNMPNGYSSLGGQVHSAFSPALDPGGSSTGSAVAVSAGFCAAAIGTDTSFSIVGCAAHNGVAGLKPAFGSLPNRGIVPISHTLDSAGPITRDFSDALLLYSCMRVHPLPEIVPADIGTLRIAVNTARREDVPSEQLAHLDALFASLKAAGAAFADVSHPGTPHIKSIMRCEFRHDLEKYLSVSSSRLKTLPDILAYYEADPLRMMKYGVTELRAALENASGSLHDAPYLDALSQRRQIRRQLFDELQSFDCCVMTGYNNLMHFAGLPSLTLPLGMTGDGAPLGIILYGVDEERLLSAALAIEKHCPGAVLPDFP